MAANERPQVGRVLAVVYRGADDHAVVLRRIWAGVLGDGTMRFDLVAPLPQGLRNALDDSLRLAFDGRVEDQRAGMKSFWISQMSRAGAF